ncbi:MAG: PhoH family protein, partial [Oscillospiraceae bacterium]|nr:PhoH family protein [Oscillospiraceae bacterium]
MVQELEFTLDQQMAVFGIQDKNTKIIETAFDVSVTARNERIEIKGDLPMSVQNAADVLNNLRVLYDSGETINRDVVYRVLESVQVGEMNETLS